MVCQHIAGRRTGRKSGAVGDVHLKETALVYQFEYQTNAFSGELS